MKPCFTNLAEICPKEWKFSLVLCKPRPEFCFFVLLAEDERQMASGQTL